MPIVDRFFTQLQPEPDDAEDATQPLSHHLSHPAIVILGDPGSGKTTSFSQSAVTEPNATFVSIRDFLTFQIDRWEGKTLYLDGLDEQRAKSEDGRTALDRIRGRLDALNRPRFRLSCRAADWYGASESERLRAVSLNNQILVLRLEPLSDDDIIKIAGDKLADPADFLAQAQRRGIDPLLRNPQTLELILAEVQDGVWPATRADLFTKACERLLKETNLEHEQTIHLPMESLLAAAGYLCTVHLCGGTKGYSLTSHDADEGFPYIGELCSDQEAINSAIRRRAFRGDGSGRVAPIHRTIAEYLSAHFFVRHLRAGYPLKRVLALLTGYDGGTLSELRGIYAWLACLCEEEAATLIRRDPLGLVLYGDAAILSISGKRMVIDCLRDLAIKNPSFRVEDWSAEPFGALGSPEMMPVFKKILNDQAEPAHLLTCILDAIEHGPPLPDLGDDLIQIVRDNARMEAIRAAALDAYRRVCPSDMASLRAFLDDINEGKVNDEHNRLRGQLFFALYPANIGPHEIGRYLVHPVDHHVNAYTMFVAHELVHRTNPEHLPLLFSGLNTTKLAGSPHHLIWEDFFGRLILKILQHLGESVSSAQLYEWFGKALDQYESPVADRDEEAAIQTWLRTHSAAVQGLFLHWFSITPFEKPRVEVIYFWRRLYSIAPPHGFHRWLLTLAERESDAARAEFLFREAVQGSTSLLREDGPTLDELFDFADNNPRFKTLLQAEMCWTIDSWRKDDAKRRRKQKQKQEIQRALRIQQLTGILDKIRSGDPTQALVVLAKVYFGLFMDLDRDASPKERLIAHTNEEIATAALEGFVAALHNGDIPSPKLIGESGTEGKEYLIGFPILAGLDVLASKSFADMLSLPEATLQSGLAFHYAIITDREREWVYPLIKSLPNLAAEALTAYWRPHLERNSKHMMGLYDLAREEVMKPVAQLVSLALLKDHPNAQSENLEQLLHAALRNGDQPNLLSYAQQVIAHHAPLTNENRALWYAMAFAIDHESVKSGLQEFVRDKVDQAATVLNFLCPSHGIKSDIQYPLPIAAMASLIAIIGPYFHPRNLSGSGWLAIRGPEGAASSIRSLIHRLGKELSQEAYLALMELQEGASLSAWRLEVVYVVADQARQRREHAFKYPTVVQVIQTLNQGRPANATDLQALVASHLDGIRAELRDGPTDGWKGMWNVDSYGRPTAPRPENDCRDRLLELLRPRLFPVGVAAEPEGHYAEDKRADIKAIIGSINLPVEVKRHYHPDLWTAPREQLTRLYARDPGTAGRGVYLVFWFGTEVVSVPSRPDIHTAAQLEAALLATLQPAEREMLEIVMIDCAPPPKSQQPFVDTAHGVRKATVLNVKHACHD